MLAGVAGVGRAAALPALTGAPNFRLAEFAPVTVAGVDNGDFARGLEGWRSVGREPPEIVSTDGGVAALLRLNTTLTSPPFVVPEAAQSIAVVARAAAGGALLEVTAVPEDGAPAVALGTIVPGPSRREFLLPSAEIRGRTVRVSLDPVAAIGRAVEVARVGPVQVIAPSWELRSGVADPVRAGGRRALRVTRGRLEMASRSFRAGPAARALLVAVRGEGRVTARAGAESRSIAAAPLWRDLRVPLGKGGRASLTIRAVPGGDPLEIADLGVVVRATFLSNLIILRNGPRVVVRGRLVPAGGRLRVSLRGASGEVSAAARSRDDGRFVLGASMDERTAVLVVTGDRTRVGARRALRLPAPPPDGGT